ncbi:MAG: alkanesulfonate monooxygenase SsuD [Candidatus Azotimanducaceae bacterium]|jgi:alkanesulfonate monooxygenase SsuD/methylene tetrahydromethanopterin reductase-like flavin-dependent oxidoreductase (luciferase family)
MTEFAVTPWSLGDNIVAGALADQAVIAENMGFHSFWLPENHFGDQRSIPSPLTLLAAVAAKTKRIKLGTTSYLITIRHPLQAAEEVAVLDQLSEGRLILGLGRGVQPAMFKAFNLPTKEKRKRFQENLDLMLAAWAGEPVAMNDDQAVILAPLPHQRPHPELWMAAFGPLALKQAGRLGMPYLASPIETLTTLETNYQQFNLAVKAAGRAPVTIVPVMRSIFISDKPTLIRDLKTAMDDGLPHAMREENASIDDWSIIGDAAYVKDRLAEYIEKLAVTHFVARGRFPVVSNKEQLDSHEQLLALGL